MSACGRKRRGCRRPRSRCYPTALGGKLLTYSDVVNAYIRNHAPRAQEETAFYGNQPTLAEAIRIAALSFDPDGGTHDHQRRVRNDALREAASELQAAEKDLKRAANFHDLFQRVCNFTDLVHGVGAKGVTAYDIAERIGARLGLRPDYVYQHNGTREGAKALGFRRRKPLSLSELPEAFQRLTPAQVEDCLCIFKVDLARIAQGG